MSPPTSPPSHAGSAATPPKRARRPRAIQACEFCRRKKYRCDGHLPCVHCRKHGIDCAFRKPEAHDPDAATYSISYVKRLERRLEIAEASARKNRRASASESASFRSPTASLTDLPPGYVKQSTSPAGILPSPRSEHQQHASRSTAAPTTEESDESAAEVVDVNSDTNAIEFHGNTSSLAFLGLVCEEYGSKPGSARSAHERRETRAQSPSLITTLHNNAFRKDHDATPVAQDGGEENYFPREAYLFLDTYFKNLHYVHPFIDQADTFRRCEDLWHGRAENQPRSFKALYFSLLSLGALIRTWTEQHISGMGRFEWSRKLFRRAEEMMIRPGAMNDLHAIQALFIMSKVCQNELNPDLAYTYLGLAIRTALSVGLNRNTPNRAKIDAVTASRVWWGMYSHEVEMSFALGRPDTLGIDAYHNREVPPLEDSACDMIPVMLPMARIMRNISIDIYLTKEDVAEKITKAVRLERDIDNWIANLPNNLRPSMDRDMLSGKSLSAEMWPNVQSLVLKLRYLNVKMILLRPFLLHAAKKAAAKGPDGSPQKLQPDLAAAINRCAQAATDTIEIIYTMYHAHLFFRTWWYNTTYVTFAASILLYYAAQDALAAYGEIDILASAGKTLEILDVMDEGVVPRKIADFIRPIVSRLRERKSQPVIDVVVAASDDRAAAAAAAAAAAGGADPDSNAVAAAQAAAAATTAPHALAPELGVGGIPPHADGSAWPGAMSEIDYFCNGMRFFDESFWDFDVGFGGAAAFNQAYLP